MHDINLTVMISSHYAVLKVIMSYNGKYNLFLTASELLKFSHFYYTNFSHFYLTNITPIFFNKVAYLSKLSKCSTAGSRLSKKINKATIT